NLAVNAPTSMQLEILPHNAARLESVCRTLATLAIEGRTVEEANDAAFQLSFVHDPIAVRYLQQVLMRSNLARNQAAFALGRIATPEAIEMLISALNGQSSDFSTLVRSVLADVGNRIQDSNLKKRIESALKGVTPR